ncbi:NYN domain-containing protein [Paeniglutamicibacter sp. MACA_103]|uniref:NYN domain-containing protein n=1 Tax=Paeniglutamicibacter sp. MACA_103 TaxID=3377337 RepID=UPI0038947726
MGMGDAKSTRRNVAVFLDMENLVGGKTAGKTALRLGELVTGIENIVRQSGMGSKAAVIRAYAHWGSHVMAGFQREMLGLGVEPVQIFSFDKQVKNAADIELCVDVLAVVQDSPWIDVFVIATGDGGFVPLVRRLHALEKYVVVVSTNDPESGVVNALLKSVADEYHQVQMSQVAAAVQMQPVHAPEPLIASPTKLPAKVAVNKKPKKAKPKATPKKASEKSLAELAKIAEIAKLHDAIFKILKQHPECRVKNRVVASTLGSFLRKEWPQLSYKACGSKTLTSFLEEHCSLGVIDAAPAQKPTQEVATPALQSVPVPTMTVPIPAPEFYVEAVRKQFTDGALGPDVRATGSAGLNLSLVGNKLRTAITGFTSLNAGFPLLHQVLDQALLTTEYRVRFEAVGAVVVHSSVA